MRVMWKRIKTFIGSVIGVWLAAVTSFLGWIPYVTGMRYDWFLSVAAMASLVVGWRLSESDD